jgi:hypothetical protein
MSAALDLVLQELRKAKTKHPGFVATHDDALDVLESERDELAAAVLRDDIAGDHGVIIEAAHVAVVALRIIESCLSKESAA